MRISSKIAVIGGSGVYKLDGVEIRAEHKITTPFGETSGPIIEASVGNASCYFLPRHGVGHIYSPSEINYRANIFALKKLGARYVISVSAVGSLKEQYAPTTFVLVDQFIDWTKGLRKRSFFDNGLVGHVSVANPIEQKLQDIIEQSCKDQKINYKRGGSYLCIEGPQFSSRAESNIYRSFGADVIGMTNVPESYLAKEAGMAYATIAMVTDYDCWKEEHCTLEQILSYIAKNNKQANLLVADLILRLSKNYFKYDAENLNCVITANDKMTDEHKEILEILTCE